MDKPLNPAERKKVSFVTD